jgi:hypothetical protein
VTTSLDESARRAGGHHWVESRLFEVLGGWVASTPEPDIRVLLDRHSHHCAWRAGQWWDRLPVLADVDRDTLSAPPTERAAAVLGELAGTESTAARLAGAYRFGLPRLWTSYHRHRLLLGPDGGVADGSTLRTLEMVETDVAGDWHEGEAAIQALLADPASIRRAAEALTAMESLLTSK